MMLNSEKQTTNSISLIIELTNKQSIKNPEIKKKLEAKAAKGPSITLEQISEKL